MTKNKKKEDWEEEYRELKFKSVSDKVNEIFQEHPNSYIEKMEEIGFTYYDDEYGAEEEAEEVKAIPENENQEYLVAYFEGRHPLTQKAFQLFMEERESDAPNYPLFRRYFKKANPELKALLCYGLDITPTSIDLLDDLTFIHEFGGILDELISRYCVACQKEQNIVNFRELVEDFYYATQPDDFNAISELKILFPPDSEKGQAVEFIASELIPDSRNAEDMAF